jgi:hypothetical protein
MGPEALSTVPFHTTEFEPAVAVPAKLATTLFKGSIISMVVLVAAWFRT